MSRAGPWQPAAPSHWSSRNRSCRYAVPASNRVAVPSGSRSASRGGGTREHRTRNRAYVRERPGDCSLSHGYLAGLQGKRTSPGETEVPHIPPAVPQQSHIPCCDIAAGARYFAAGAENLLQCCKNNPAVTRVRVVFFHPFWFFLISGPHEYPEDRQPLNQVDESHHPTL